MNRIDELQQRMLKADRSGAGQAARLAAGQELLKFADRAERFAAYKPMSRVGRYCRRRAHQIRQFVRKNGR